VKPSEFLSIDVESELRAVCALQVKGSWQLAAEAVRFGIRHGATAVEVSHSKRGFVARCVGAVCSQDHLERVAVVLDSEHADEDRHRAIVGLEEDGVQCLLWLAGSPEATVRLATRPTGSATVLETRPRQRPGLETDAAAEIDSGFEVEFSSSEFDVQRSQRWLGVACRFAPIAVTIDGEDVAKGFSEALFSVSLGRPLPGGIAITPDGDAPHLWLLRHGVLSARATVAGFPPFEAAVELGSITPEGAIPDELRQTVNPHLPVLVDRAVELLVDAVEQGPYVDSDRLTRIATLVLRTARKGIQRERVEGLAVFPSVDLGSGARALMSLEELRRMSDEDGVTLWSAPPDTDVSRLPADGRRVLLLTPEQHGIVAEVVTGAVQRPEPRPRSGWRALTAVLARTWSTIWRRFAPNGVGRELKDAELLAAELALVSKLEGITSHADGEVVQARLCAGVGRVKRQAQTLLLPRNNPLVVQAVRLIETDDRWLYPALLAVVGDHAMLPPDLRSQWRERVLTSDRK
jgi:hypothetical protein